MMYVTINRDFGFNRGINALFVVSFYYRLHIIKNSSSELEKKLFFLFSYNYSSF